ncbi:hypothetical protein N9E35_01425 [Candidatus Marinimicrobia bacterium]|nr:hypothetical protein [Candidatus Neomarinimicrobiota bacterium]
MALSPETFGTIDPENGDETAHETPELVHHQWEAGHHDSARWNSH